MKKKKIMMINIIILIFKKRIEKAYKNNEKFKVNIIINLLQAIPCEIEDATVNLSSIPSSSIPPQKKGLLSLQF